MDLDERIESGFQLGTYGTLGLAAPGNVPGAREWAAGWIDQAGNLWPFGGDISEVGWKFNGSIRRRERRPRILGSLVCRTPTKLRPRLGGHAEFTIDYQDYQITAVGPLRTTITVAETR